MRTHLPDILAAIGVATIVSGVAIMHIPSALILAGAAVVLLAYSLHRTRL